MFSSRGARLFRHDWRHRLVSPSARWHPSTIMVQTLFEAAARSAPHKGTPDDHRCQTAERMRDEDDESADFGVS